MPACTADEEAARLPMAAEHASSADSAFPPPFRDSVPWLALRSTLAAANPQVGVALVLVTLISTFFAILAPALEPRSLLVAAQSTYAVLAATTLALLTITTAIDAADAALQTPDQRWPKLYCPHCSRRVAPGSKHCRRCDKCVADFDHHCVFLNNCIGGHNYRWFLASLVAAVAAAAAHCAAAAWLLARSFVAVAATRAALRRAHTDHVSLTALRVIAGVTAAMALIAGLLSAELLAFHVYLRYKGMTTYDSIMARRAAKQAAMAAVAALTGTQPAAPSAWQRMRAVLRCRGAKVAPAPEDGGAGGWDPACGGLQDHDVNAAGAELAQEAA